jgi:hypothetical protein
LARVWKSLRNIKAAICSKPKAWRDPQASRIDPFLIQDAD